MTTTSTHTPDGTIRSTVDTDLDTTAASAGGPTWEELAWLWSQPAGRAVARAGDIAAVFRHLSAHGVSQRRMARLTGQCQSEISEILGGRRVRSIEVATRIVDGLALPREPFGLAPRPTPTPTEPHPDRTDPPAETGDEATVEPARWRRCRYCGQWPADAPPPRPATPPTVAPGLPTPALWTGTLVRMLRESRRMSVRRFAHYLGVSDRTVSQWERAGATVRPSPVNQQALDACLAMATHDEQARFIARVNGRNLSHTPGSASTAAPTSISVVRA